MQTEGKLRTILFIAIWQILLADSFDRKHSALLESSNITNGKREFHTLNLLPKDEVFMSNQSMKNNTIFISKSVKQQPNPYPNQPLPQPPPQQPPPQPPPQQPPPQPPPPPIQAPPPDCPICQCPDSQPCQCQPCPESYCAPCPPCQCPPCHCPEKPQKIYIEETEEYEETVVRRIPG